MRGDIAWADAKLAGLCRRRGAGPGLAERVGRGRVTIGLQGDASWRVFRLPDG